MKTEKRELMKKGICPRCKTGKIEKSGVQQKVLRCKSCGWTKSI